MEQNTDEKNVANTNEKIQKKDLIEILSKKIEEEREEIAYLNKKIIEFRYDLNLKNAILNQLKTDLKDVTKQSNSDATGDDDDISEKNEAMEDAIEETENVGN